MLSAAAFNALLKTLEEPPEHVKFMFATTDPEKVLPTILSRCQRFDLRRIPTALISKHLALIAEQEGVKVEPAALHAIARGAEGGMRDAESTLDQLISFCGNSIEEADVLSMFGLAGQQQLLALSEAILDGRIETALRELNELATNGKDLGRLMADLLNHFRNLLIYLVGSGDLSMLEVSEAEAGALAKQATMVGTAGRQTVTAPAKGAPMAGADIVGRILDSLAETDLKMRGAASRKIILEVGILKAIEARNSISLDAVLTQLRALRAEGGGSAPSGSSGAPRQEDAATRPSSAHPSARPAASPAMSLSEAPVAAHASALAPQNSGAEPDIDGVWTLLLNAANPMARAALERAQPVGLANHVFTIGFHPEDEAQISFVDTPRNLAQFQAKLKESGWGNVQLKFTKLKADAPRPVSTVSLPPVAAPVPTQAPQKTTEKPTGGATARKAELPPVPGKEREAAAPVFDKEQFKNDPLIKKALEIFKGQIVEVRS
jgi:DNA polymerase-3 subunit gamma/tau